MNAVAAVPVVGDPLFLNSPQEISRHISLGQLRWAAPLLFLPARTLFSFLRVSSPPSIGLRVTHLHGTQPEIGGPFGAHSLTSAASLAFFF
jgi:hypothetical protein